MEPDLTLDKAKRMIRQREAVKAQQEILKGKEKEEISLHAVDKYAPRRKLPAIPPQTKLPKHKPSVLQTCRRCGKGSHPRQESPAREAICFCCNRRGHFGNQCLSSTVVNTKGDLNELTMDYTRDHQDTTSSYLDTVRGEQNWIWEVEVTVNNRTVPFKVDTGVEVTAISGSLWE